MADPVEIVPYDPEWPLRYGREKERLVEALGETARRIEHVGSTAVPGLAAKPVIDIQISVDSLEQMDAYRPALEELGYAYLSDDEPEHRFFFLAEDGRRAVHVHVCAAGSDWEIRHLAFRDYLIAHPAVADAYETQKRRLVEKYRDDRAAYAASKTPFIRAIDDHAINWRSTRG